MDACNFDVGRRPSLRLYTLISLIPAARRRPPFIYLIKLSFFSLSSEGVGYECQPVNCRIFIRSSCIGNLRRRHVAYEGRSFKKSRGVLTQLTRSGVYNRRVHGPAHSTVCLMPLRPHIAHPFNGYFPGKHGFLSCPFDFRSPSSWIPSLQVFVGNPVCLVPVCSQLSYRRTRLLNCYYFSC